MLTSSICEIVPRLMLRVRDPAEILESSIIMADFIKWSYKYDIDGDNKHIQTVKHFIEMN